MYHDFFVIIMSLLMNYEYANCLLKITNFNFPAIGKKIPFHFSFGKSTKVLVFDFVNTFYFLFLYIFKIYIGLVNL